MTGVAFVVVGFVVWYHRMGEVGVWVVDAKVVLVARPSLLGSFAPFVVIGPYRPIVALLARDEEGAYLGQGSRSSKERLVSVVSR